MKNILVYLTLVASTHACAMSTYIHQYREESHRQFVIQQLVAQERNVMIEGQPLTLAVHALDNIDEYRKYVLCDAQANPLAFIMFAVRTNEICGIQFGKKTGRIEILLVHPDHRKKGHATTLMDYALKQIENNGIEETDLYVNRDNTPAIKLYERFGFKHCQRIPRIFANYYVRAHKKPAH